jgi:hypothetical protein
MKVPNPQRKVRELDLGVACLAVGTTPQDVRTVWGYAHQYQSWDLHTFMVAAPSPTSIKKAQRVVSLLIPA